MNFAQNHRLRAKSGAGNTCNQCDSLRSDLEREKHARADLLSVVSHELRTPLAVISGFSRLLLDDAAGPLTDEQRKLVQESKRSCERLDGLVSRLLSATNGSLEAEALDLEVAPIEPLVADVLRFFGPHFGERDLELNFDAEASIGADVSFDRCRTEQVLTNLLGNALKYARSGGRVDVEVGFAVPSPDDEAGGRGGGAVEVRISDDGPGIRAEDRDRVFEPWVRTSGSGLASGLGLGLAISRHVVEEQGGRIWVEQSASGGCRFHFTLPLASGDADRAAAQDEAGTRDRDGEHGHA